MHSNNRYLLTGLLTGLGLLGLVGQAAAANEATDRHHLDEMVVSATRTETPVADVPQSVTVIGREEIMSSPFTRVEDIVRNVPGMFNARHYGTNKSGVCTPLKIRGVGNQRVLILVDGVPQNDNFNNALTWIAAWGYIPKEAIERIEIVRGPTSALYGSEALGGVVHIITKKAAAERESSVAAETGTAATYSGSLYHSQTAGDWDFLAAGGYSRSDGFYMLKDPQAQDTRRESEMTKGFGKLSYAPDANSSLTLGALAFTHESSQGHEFFNSDNDVAQYWLDYAHRDETADFKGLLFVNRDDRMGGLDSAADNYSSRTSDELLDAATWGADAQLTLKTIEAAKITLGTTYKESVWDFDMDYHTAPNRDSGAEGRQQTISPFVNADFKLLSDRLIVNLGARYDLIRTSDGLNYDTAASAGLPAYRNEFDSNTESCFSPKLGLAWHPDDVTTLRLSGGKGFRAPSLIELYKVHVRQSGTYYRSANPELESESLWSYELGAERFLNDQLWGRFTVYQSFAKDYIGDRLTGTSPFSGKTRYEYKLDNISEVDIHGAEIELEWTPLNELSLFANYAYNVTKVAKDQQNPALKGNYLPNDPRHSAHLGLRYRNPRICDLSLTTNYYSDIYFDNENTYKTDAFWTVDLGLARRLSQQLSAYANVENLFDRKYPMSMSNVEETIAPGAIYSAGLKFEF